MNQEPIREVVRLEYFSRTNEPAITFKHPTVKFNAVCLKKLPDIDYLHFIIERFEKKLIIEPCNSDERNAIRWSGVNNEKHTAKTITCREFYRRITELMMWSNDCRYKVFGKIINNRDKKPFIAFDLKSAIMYKPSIDGKISNIPEYPPEWDYSFGESIEQNKNNPLIRRFAEDAEFIITKNNFTNVEEENG